jgi:hypothetical protein
VRSGVPPKVSPMSWRRRSGGAMAWCSASVTG